MNYHAHIYWKSVEEKNIALSTRIYLEKQGCILGRIWDIPKGPHPLPMFQVKYNSKNKILGIFSRVYFTENKIFDINKLEKLIKIISLVDMIIRFYFNT